jgi:hypothetical protein
MEEELHAMDRGIRAPVGQDDGVPRQARRQSDRGAACDGCQEGAGGGDDSSPEKRRRIGPEARRSAKDAEVVHRRAVPFPFSAMGQVFYYCISVHALCFLYSYYSILLSQYG